MSVVTKKGSINERQNNTGFLPIDASSSMHAAGEGETVQYGDSFIYSNDTADISQAEKQIRSVLSQLGEGKLLA